MKTNSEIKAKRLYLKGISDTLKNTKASGEIRTINEGLKEIYRAQGLTNLQTFEQWKMTGYQVKRGAKAVYIWGKQRSKKIVENGIEKEILYFPMLAVFSENQVYNPFNEK